MYGLVFAGGGIRGAYEIGVWRAINELGVEVGAVSGTSIGSVNGAFFAMGEFKKAEKIWREITAEQVLDITNFDTEKLLHIKNIPALIEEIRKNKGVSMKPFFELLKENVDEEKVRNSKIQFGLITYSLSDNKPMELFIEDIPKGKLAEYLIASSTLPGIQPLVIGNKMFLDGGLSDNKPQGMLINRGFNNIISVDVGGVGVVKKPVKTGVNIIDIKCSTPLVGMLEFNQNLISETIERGYFDTKRAFGKVMGDIYPIRTREYILAKSRYSSELIKGIEIAAEIFGINKYKEYSVISLARETIKEYKKILKQSEGETIDKLSFGPVLFASVVSYINDGKGKGYPKAASQVLKKYASAVNSLCYFLRKF